MKCNRLLKTDIEQDFGRKLTILRLRMWIWDCSALWNLAISKHLTYMNEIQRLIENCYRTELGDKTYHFEAEYVDL